MKEVLPEEGTKDAHKAVQAKAPKGRRKRFGPLETKHTVTSVAWLPDSHVVASSGDRDDVVKLWDLRKAGNAALRIRPAVDAECLGSSPSQTIGKRQHGVTCLMLSPEGTRLLVSCSNSRHYLLNAMQPHRQPLASFSGHVNGSFYIRACFSGDGSHILSGSSDHKAYIWEVAKPQKPPQVLRGNAGEVTGVAWCSTDPTQIVTCHDNATVSVWTLDRSRDIASEDLEPTLAPVTPGAVQAHKERFGMPVAQRKSPLQDALDDAAAKGMQEMLPCKEPAAPNQPVPVQLPLKCSLQQPSLALSPGKAAMTEFTAHASVPARLDKEQNIPFQQSSQHPAGQESAQHANHREPQHVEMGDSSGAQEAVADAKTGNRDEAPYKQGADAQCHISIEYQLDATSAAIKPDQPPDDDNLPLTSLFASAEAAPTEQHSNGEAGMPEGSQRLSEDSAASQPTSQESNQENQLPQGDVDMLRPEDHQEDAPSSPERPAFNLHAWADRFERHPRSARQPLASITGHPSSQGHASQMSRDERPETDPIDFNLLAAMDSRGLASQPFPAFGTQNTQHEGQIIREAAEQALTEAYEVLSPDGRRGIDIRLPPQCRQPPAQRTPPAMVLEEAMGFCRERLSLSPDKERPVTECAAANECAPTSKCNHGNSNGQHEAQEQDQSRQHGSACPPPNGQENENSQAAGVDLCPPPFVPSLLDDGMVSRLSVWEGKQEPMTGFLKQFLPQSRREKGEQRHEEAGPLPGDGFMGESPAPRQAVLTQTPLQDRQRPKNEQDEAASTHKRKQPTSTAKQRSIMEFFKTPPAQPAQKRSKENDGQA